MKLLSVAASRFPVERVYIFGEVLPSELDFHIGNANSQLFARGKTEAKMAARGGKFCTSISVLIAVLYVSSSPLHDFCY